MEKPIVRAQSVPVIIGVVVTLYIAAVTLVCLHRSVAQKNWFQSLNEPGGSEHRPNTGLDAIVKLYTASGPDALANLSFTTQEELLNNAQLEEYTHKWWENCPSVKELSNKYHLHPHIAECKFKGRGNMTFLVMGNSHAKHNMFMIAKAFENDFTCVPIKGLEDFAACRQYRRAMMDTVSRVRPDALFLIFKFMGPDLPELQEPLVNDTNVARFQTELDELSQNVGTIFIGLPHLKFDYDVPMEIAKRLEINQSLDTVNLKLEEHYSFHKNRFRMLGALECAKCVWIDWTQAFCNRTSGVCDAMERNTLIGYFIDLTHYSVLGSLKALPLFEELRTNWTRGRLIAA
ncbi:hypothetical protein AAVH_13996 [Aphelenchoides avenae]|nr:hypothetical protein AAVH_13996 [Aphelenchus avenae]